MLCVPFHNLRVNQQGSALVGFALVAPLVVFVFMLVIQVGIILADRATLLAATQSGSRAAATFNGSDTHGRLEARTILQSRGLVDDTVVTIVHERRGSMTYVIMRASMTRTIDLLHITVRLTEQARSIDERYV